MKLKTFISSVGLAFAGLSVLVQARADSWRFPATIQSIPEQFGDVTVRRIRDARKNQQYPDYSVEITRGNILLARIPGVYYEKLFPAPDGSFFVGLSNEGLPGTAVIIFDREGGLRVEVKHGWAVFDYCKESVSLVREWFDVEKPNVTFTKHPDWDAYRVSLRTCRGKQVELADEVRDAYRRASERRALAVR